MMEDRRQNDALLIAMDQRFTDFMDRYERDQLTAHAWRSSISNRLGDVETFISELKPLHKKAMWTVTLIVVGTVAYWVKVFWDHVKWA
jgi:hypothetical protein